MRLTSSRTITDVTVKATGAASVTYSGVDYTFNEEGTALITLNTTDATLVFNPASNDKRIFVALVSPGVNLQYTNTSLLSCELNLRSDLTMIDPSLPESEITIRVYEPNDVRDVMSRVFEENPVTYQAGYAGDMSPVRKFYLAEPAVWSDKVLTIKAVDAVHLLDQEIKPFYLGWYNAGNTSETNNTDLRAHYKLYECFLDQIKTAGVELVSEEYTPNGYYSSAIKSKGNVSSVVEAQPARELVANMMNLCHQDYASGYFNGLNSFWLTFVDAGRPTVYWSKPTSRWDIYEEDCGDIVTNVDRKITKIKAPNKRVQVKVRNSLGLRHEGSPRGNQNVGSIDITYQDGGVYNFNTYASYVTMYLSGKPTASTVILNTAILGGEVYDQYNALPAGYSSYSDTYGKRIYTGQQQQGWYQVSTHAPSGSTALIDYWFDTLLANGYIDEGDETFTVQCYGGCYNVLDNPTEYTSGGTGITVEPKDTYWIGRICAGKFGDSSSMTELLPSKGFKSILARSLETGSFTWKGDPRMQPRDVFTFHKLDGTTELRTIESIELKHEAGGTVASITYRKGIV